VQEAAGWRLPDLIRALVEAAAALGIAETTAKTHLSRIFAKTGVSRQAELVALVHRLTPPLQREL
jgi:DNA-binding CsgD family transcriptional regulator